MVQVYASTLHITLEQKASHLRASSTPAQNRGGTEGGQGGCKRAMKVVLHNLTGTPKVLPGREPRLSRGGSKGGMGCVNSLPCLGAIKVP